jgi:hypothetical protein
MIDVNSRDQKVVDIVMSLATAALVLPALFLKTYLGVQDEPLAIFLEWPVYVAWSLLFISLCLGLTFHYLSTKWVLLAWKREISISRTRLDLLMGWVFWTAMVTFCAGLAFLMEVVTELACPGA